MALLNTMSFHGVASAAMIYYDQPIVDYFRELDERKIIGGNDDQGDDRIYFFELERVHEPSAPFE